MPLSRPRHRRAGLHPRGHLPAVQRRALTPDPRRRHRRPGRAVPPTHPVGPPTHPVGPPDRPVAPPGRTSRRHGLSKRRASSPSPSSRPIPRPPLLLRRPWSSPPPNRRSPNRPAPTVRRRPRSPRSTTGAISRHHRCAKTPLPQATTTTAPAGVAAVRRRAPRLDGVLLNRHGISRRRLPSSPPRSGRSSQGTAGRRTAPGPSPPAIHAIGPSRPRARPGLLTGPMSTRFGPVNLYPHARFHPAKGGESSCTRARLGC